MDQENLIKKWLNNDLTEAERKTFDALEDASFYKDIIANASHFKASKFSSIDDFETFKKRSLEKETKVRKLDWFKPAMRIASVAVVALGLFYIFNLNSLTEVETQIAEKNVITLPDASQVTLNAQSEIAYNDKKWKNHREIQLKGEAFFDVAKGEKFDVVTESGIISVLGTEFNVKQRGSFFEVACFEGTVKVATKEDTVTLNVGDNITVINGKLTKGSNAFPEPQWTKNKSYFQRTPVSEVFAELQRQFGVTVKQENIDTKQLFTGGFDHTNLANAVMAIGQPLGMDHKIQDGNTVVFSQKN